jgi:hypothetical protein
MPSKSKNRRKNSGRPGKKAPLAQEERKKHAPDPAGKYRDFFYSQKKRKKCVLVVDRRGAHR